MKYPLKSIVFNTSIQFYQRAVSVIWSQQLGVSSHQHPAQAELTDEGVKFSKGKLSYQNEIRVPMHNVVQYEIDYGQIDLRKKPTPTRK